MPQNKKSMYGNWWSIIAISSAELFYIDLFVVEKVGF